MSRTGKIARLPRALRDTLNCRLQDGEPGPELLAWLNADPAVQAVLAEHFNGQPINAQNLSEWRRGGHAAWCQQQQILDLAERLQEEKPELDRAIGEVGLAASLNQAALLALLRELRATWGQDEGPDRLRGVLAIIGAYQRLQRMQLEAGRAQRERAHEARTARPVERTEDAPPVAPARFSPPPPERDAVSADDDQKIAKVWAAAMKLAASAPGKPGSAPASYMPKLPVPQAA